MRTQRPNDSFFRAVHGAYLKLSSEYDVLAERAKIAYQPQAVSLTEAQRREAFAKRSAFAWFWCEHSEMLCDPCKRCKRSPASATKWSRVMAAALLHK